MFLPDRFIKGECPKCGAKDQYGDNCEVCGAVYAPDRPEQPVLGPVAAPRRCCRIPSISSSSCPTRAAWRFWSSGRRKAATLQPEVANKIKEWFTPRRSRRHQPRRPGRLGHQPRRALLRHRNSRRAGQVLLCLAGRAHRLPGLAEEPCSTRRGADYDAFMADPATEQYHFIGKDIITFHTLFWPAHAAFQRPQDAQQRVRARLSDREQRREDEQEPRHRPGPAQVPEPGHEPGVAALLPGRQAQQPQRRHRLQRRGFHGARQQRPGGQVHQHRLARGGLHQPSALAASWARSRPTAMPCWSTCATPCRRLPSSTPSANTARRCARPCCWPTA